MFGANPTRPLDRSDGHVLTVQEVFRTIQGEGPDTGTPATFVRLWGCHLHCWFCDTDFESVQRRAPISQLVRECRTGPRLVVLTGGEPMRQHIAPLCSELLTFGHHVQIETAGNFDFHDKWCPTEGGLTIVVSPKGPAMHPELCPKATAFKYVVSARQPQSHDDGLPIADYQQKQGVPRRLARPPIDVLLREPHRVFVQPMDEQDVVLNRGNAILCAELAQRFGYRVSLQTHKILGVP